MITKTKGVVLKEFRFRETSKILTLYTLKYGKIQAMARGAYRPKSQLIANTQTFSYNEYQLYKGKNFYYINQGDIIDSFYSIRENIDRLMYGSYLLELMDLSTMEEEQNEKLFFLLLKGLSVLSKLDRGFVRFILAYELKFISFLGYKPLLDRCANCGNKDLNVIKFSIEKGGIICKDCFRQDNFCENMDSNMYKAMKSLLYTPLDEIMCLKIPECIMFKLHAIMEKYILNKIDREKFNSLMMLKSMK
ncbi:DNA replication and repair protein RecO [Keratinibaculum paraultunense]|uniref:DNA repair protein RecO n=1 Tax=Keratinibaculum paraultunense TaxID=1278232 RepID=A0A4R3KZH3_9FIRM|nr:DNA repair protein RecO [Keratinibaculum paraultunense]QQY80480.1 DNA repair protein RecO [Keratinibaculum paraultunense]TCS91199.1 DNA replication and repair protein RecO [Keratinibaculum paraultunense]